MAQQPPKPPANPTPSQNVTGVVGAHRSQDELIRLIQSTQQKLAAFSTAKQSPAAVRRDLERTYMQMVQRKTFPNASDVEGHLALRVVYKYFGENIPLTWDYYPPQAGIGCSVIGICPDCFVQAGTVDPTTRTRPTFIDGMLRYAQGNQNADMAVTMFRLTSPLFHIELDERKRLNVREVIRCPSVTSYDKKLRNCDWAVRCEDGVLTRVTRGIIRSGGKKRPITGPLIIVK